MTTLIAVSIDFPVELLHNHVQCSTFQTVICVFVWCAEKKSLLQTFRSHTKQQSNNFPFWLFSSSSFQLIITIFGELKRLVSDQECANTQTRQWLKNIFETFVDSFILQHQLFWLNSCFSPRDILEKCSNCKLSIVFVLIFFWWKLFVLFPFWLP